MVFVAVRRPTTEGVTGVPRAQGERPVPRSVAGAFKCLTVAVLAVSLLVWRVNERAEPMIGPLVLLAHCVGT